MSFSRGIVQIKTVFILIPVGKSSISKFALSELTIDHLFHHQLSLPMNQLISLDEHILVV